MCRVPGWHPEESVIAQCEHYRINSGQRDAFLSPQSGRITVSNPLQIKLPVVIQDTSYNLILHSKKMPHRMQGISGHGMIRNHLSFGLMREPDGKSPDSTSIPLVADQLRFSSIRSNIHGLSWHEMLRDSLLHHLMVDLDDVDALQDPQDTPGPR